jgi:hypothetical protein
MLPPVKIGLYEVLGVLGQGGVGSVHRARSPSGEEVAIKVLLRQDPERLARFERERRLIAELGANEGFVPLLDSGTSAQGPYLVMPLMAGGTLRDRLERGPLAVSASLAIGRDLARALALAHARGIVHRDLKPENVLFAHRGAENGDGDRPLVADLGLGKHFDRGSAGGARSVSLSVAGDLRGTAGYMAPEQVVDAKSAGPPADVFAIGAILYECLAGRPPFGGDDVLELLARLADGRFEPLGRVRPDVPAWVVSVVERALAKAPGDRYADGAALLAALNQAGPKPGRRLDWALGTSALVVLLGMLALAAIHGVPGRERESVLAPPGPTPSPSVPGEPAPTRAPPPPQAAPAPALPPGLVPGARVHLPGSGSPGRGVTEVQVYLFRLPDGSDMELVSVPAGDFFMGSDDQDALDWEKPRHMHHVPRASWIGRNDVTWKQFLAYCEATGAARPARPSWAGDDHPVVNVSWEDAAAYCRWAKLSLPSEADWEDAARGVDARRFPWGDVWDISRCNVADSHLGGTAPVGRYASGVSPRGAFDMAGNVWQWCEDWYDPGAYARYRRGDTAAATSGEARVARGGSWRSGDHVCRSWARSGRQPTDREDLLGFRVALRPPPSR